MTGSDRSGEALDWARRLHDPGFAEWDAHVEWLEASPDNAVALDRALLAIEAASTGLAPARMPSRTVASRPDERPSHRWWPALAAGVALTIGVLGAIEVYRPEPAALRTLVAETGPGERRTVRLPGGTEAALNGDTRLAFDMDSRHATLDHGEAFFTVVHDAARPFTVSAGDARFRDVGTAFDLVHTPLRTELAVREGQVLFDPDGQKLAIGRGQALRIARADTATRRPLDPLGVGGWRSGRLTFADAPMSDVAADLGRALGRPVSLDARAADRRFSGVIAVDRDSALTARRAAAVTGLAAVPDGAGWRLTLPGH